MHLICFIMAVISTAAPTGAIQLPVTTLRGVISAGASRQVYGGREGGEGGARHRCRHYGRHSSLISPLADDDDQHTAAHHRR